MNQLDQTSRSSVKALATLSVPAAEQGVLEGYFVITADDLEEAASIAASCPHLRYGGTVSLRRLAG